MASYDVKLFDNKDESFDTRENFLDETLPNMKWGDSDVVLDIGSGPGYVTRKILWSKLEKYNVNMLIGMDSNEKMNKVANQLHGLPGKISFEYGNISNINSINPSWFEKFDKAFSFYALQDVFSMKNDLNNINRVMKMNGEVAFLFTAQNRLTKAQISIFNHPDWKSVFEGKDRNISCQNEIFCSENLEKSFENLLDRCGFQTISCKTIVMTRKYATKEDYMNFILAIDSNYGNVPEEYKKSYECYMHDQHVNTPIKLSNGTVSNVLNDDGSYFHAEEILTIHAVKNKNVHF